MRRLAKQVAEQVGSAVGVTAPITAQVQDERSHAFLGEHGEETAYDLDELSSRVTVVEERNCENGGLPVRGNKRLSCLLLLPAGVVSLQHPDVSPGLGAD